MKNERVFEAQTRSCGDRGCAARNGAADVLHQPGRPALLHAVVVRCSAWLFTLVLLAGGVAPDAEAHSVGQIQTTKFLEQSTVNMLVARAAMGGGGLVPGDVVTYIIQFTPVQNSANVGVNGYVTDYIPPNTQVQDAAFVLPNGSGGWNRVSPQPPGGSPNGWGNTWGQRTFGAPFNVAAYDPTGRCTTGGFTNNCNARLAQVAGDTGIFYSTDPRTAVFPAAPTRIVQGGGGATNGAGGGGYNVNPAAGGQLTPLLNETQANVHNLWDADQARAFGSTLAAWPVPTSTVTPINVGGTAGRGTTPYNAGSPVAGPEAGMQLDNTGSVGPWRRVSYAGSRIGDISAGPAVANGTLNVVTGSVTTLGWALSAANPLPAGTNAVRWAVGKLIVGQTQYVQLTVKLLASPPVAGVINSSEVFGGDASDEDTLKFFDSLESPWAYMVASVADNNSNLYVLKDVVCVYQGATCVSNPGLTVPLNARIRYRITYVNTGVTPQYNVVLSDTLPCMTPASSVTNAVVTAGANILPFTPAAPAAGNCAVSPTTSATITFQSITELGPGNSGAILFDVQTNTSGPTTVGSLVTNGAKLVSTDVPTGVTTFFNSLISASANLTVSKTTSTPTINVNGTATYQISITNNGTTTASGIVVADFLPFAGTVSTSGARFGYVTGSSVVSGLAFSNNVVTTSPPTVAPYSANTNQEQVRWTMPAAAQLGVNQTFTISFNALAGPLVPASVTPYLNAVSASYATTGTAILDSAAAVTVVSPLTLAKAIDCVFANGTCNAYTTGNPIPSNAKIRYKITATNTLGSNLTGVHLCDAPPTQIVSYAAAVSTPGVAPVPAGPFTSSANVGARVNPANAACGTGYAGATSFSFPVPGNLTAGATAIAYVDVQTNAATSGLIVTNNARAVATTVAGGVDASVTAVVSNVPILTISKTAAASTVSPGGVVSYTVTITNAGTATASRIVVSDFLPYEPVSPANATMAFRYAPGSSSVVGIGAVTPVSFTPPVIAPYSSNTNQQEVRWGFTAANLGPGMSFTITYSATAGALIQASPPDYLNTVQAAVSSGSTVIAIDTAPVTVTVPLTIAKTIDCVYNPALSACNAYSGGVVAPAARIRYKIVATNTGGSNQTNAFICDRLPSQIVSYAASVSTPAIAPTPAGPFTSSANVNAAQRTSPANAACGFTGGGITFSNIINGAGVLTAGASVTTFIDVQTNAASGAVVSNSAYVVSTQVPGGSPVSVVTTTAIGAPILSVTKSTSTPSIFIGGVATYSVVVANIGSITATSIVVNDFLPFDATTGPGAASRFGFVTASTTVVGIAATTNIVTSAPPVVAPYNSNTNQEQVAWNFGASVLGPGQQFTLTFRAQAGGNVTPSSVPYYNTVQGVASGGVSVSTSSNTAPVLVTWVGQISGFVYLDANVNSLLDSTEAGTGQTLFVKLVPRAGAVCTGPATAVVAVNSTTGAYTLPPPSSGNYCLVLDNNNTLSDVTPAYPAGWGGTEAPTGIIQVTQPVSGTLPLQNFGLFNGAVITGRVFADTGAPAGTANNGIQDGTELGLAGVTVKLTNCSGTTHLTTQTDSTGSYRFAATAAVIAATPPLCVEETNLPNYVSLGASIVASTGASVQPLTSGAVVSAFGVSYTYCRSAADGCVAAALPADTIKFNAAVPVGLYTSLRFGDVPPNLFLTDGAQQTSPGNVVSYPHMFTAGSGGVVSFGVSVLATQPAWIGWGETLYLDTNCNGLLDGGETTILTTASTVSVTAGQKVCVILKETTPPNAPNGAQRVVSVTAGFNYTNAGPALRGFSSRTDTTTIGEKGDGLRLRKEVCNVTVQAALASPCNAVVSSGNGFSVDNIGQPGDELQYRIVYTNQSAQDLSTLVISDATPPFTVQAATAPACPAPPAALPACQPITSPGAGNAGGFQWRWLPAEILRSGSSGVVTFNVTIQ